MSEQADVASADPEPFARIFRHWVDERPYLCLGDNCPLCGVGDEAKAVVFFDAVTISAPEIEITQPELELGA